MVSVIDASKPEVSSLSTVVRASGARCRHISTSSRNASLLPERVQDLIGRVGAQTEGVRKMLEAVGLEYSNRIDPFDGGPHFEARTDAVTPVRDARQWELQKQPLDLNHNPEDVRRVLVAHGSRAGPTKFRAVVSKAKTSSARIHLPAEARSKQRAPVTGSGPSPCNLSQFTKDAA